MQDTGFWILDTGYWILDAGYWMQDAAIEQKGSSSRIQNQVFDIFSIKKVPV